MRFIIIRDEEDFMEIIDLDHIDHITIESRQAVNKKKKWIIIFWNLNGVPYELGKAFRLKPEAYDYLWGLLDSEYINIENALDSAEIKNKRR
ncbi:hypothetical protein DRH29_06075 [candidate division Kazan bacterium]|uniref:Uncharacterized protein n=1 Tax=candidate division Kazan bacterium TaxID=2202143 RepID=A0A420ZAI0_UNCK3|nr:MAG: hypothetical protein DRH29_06075 [candidate division Kazan bacterium]